MEMPGGRRRRTSEVVEEAMAGGLTRADLYMPPV